MDQHVLRLQIAMNDLFGVEVLQPLKQLSGYRLDSSRYLSKIVQANAQRRTAAIQKVAKRAVRAVFHLDIQAVAAVL